MIKHISSSYGYNNSLKRKSDDEGGKLKADLH